MSKVRVSLPARTNELQRELGQLMRLLRPFPRSFTTANLTPVQSLVLYEIGQQKDLPVGKLVELLDLDKSTVSQMLTVFKNKEFIDLITDPNDKRKKSIRLLPQGQNLVQQINALFREELESRLSGFTEQEKNGLAIGLALLNAMLNLKAPADFANNHNINQENQMPTLVDYNPNWLDLAE